ncbi:Flp family type IVb pilin [Trinickia sp. EG282A]|uniref:Flp family type IVb pilin n=1 Tax=Trinickia sp. EG282A TaxID=3237013 RepID=UPI0034D3060E
MLSLRVILSKVWKEDDGATMVEYAFMVSLIALVALAGVATFGNAVLGLYQNIRDEIVAALH